MIFIRISQADFDALVIKDPNTCYVINGKNIMYEGASTTPVNVPMSEYVPHIASIAVTTHPSKTNYEVGEQLDLSGMIVTATYDDATTEVIENYTTVPAEGSVLTALDTSILITYGDKSTTEPITVFSLLSISVTTHPAKTTYYEGDALELAGIVVTGLYSDGTTRPLTCTYNPANGSPLALYHSRIEITYQNKICYEPITVNAVSLVSIEVTHPPRKTTYMYGETFDTTDLVVTGTYNSGATANVTSQCSFYPSLDTPLTIDNRSILITLAELSDTQDILVTGLEVGGKIFYIDSSSTGATYTFYDDTMTELPTQTIAGLATARYYLQTGTPLVDKFYVANTTLGVVSNKQWGKIDTTIGVSSTAIGTGKSNSVTCLAITDWESNSVWTWLQSIRSSKLLGHNDWYIGSKDEVNALRLSTLVNWFTNYDIWTSSEYTSSPERFAWDWFGTDGLSEWSAQIKDTTNGVFAMRSF